MEILIAGLNTFTGWLLIASLKSLPLISVILLLQYGFKKNLSAHFRHSLWLIIFVCLSVPFGWKISWGPASGDELFPYETAATTIQSRELQHNLPAKGTAAISSVNAEQIKTYPSLPFSFHSMLSCIWGVVFLFLSAVTLWQAKRFNRIKKLSTPASASQERLLDNNKITLGLNKKIPLLYSAQVQSPLTFGLFKPVIILPINIDQQLTQHQLNHVLLHELAHIQRHDILWNWLAFWATLLHWFNPLIWFAYKRMKGDMEMACDARVLAHLSNKDRSNYGLTLITVSQLISENQGSSHSLGILENHRELKHRLIMIKDYTTMNMKRTLAFGTLLSLLALTALAQPEQKATESGGHISTENSITLQQFAAKAEQDLKVKILIGINSDSRIQTNIGKNPISYEHLLTQLQINGFTAFRTRDYIQIVSVHDARTLAPIAEKGKVYFDDEFVTDYIKLEKSCANVVLATVRPLVPQHSHLTTYTDARTLIIVDSYSNIQRVKNVIATIEKNLDAPTDCAEVPQMSQTQKK